MNRGASAGRPSPRSSTAPLEQSRQSRHCCPACCRARSRSYCLSSLRACRASLQSAARARRRMNKTLLTAVCMRWAGRCVHSPLRTPSPYTPAGRRQPGPGERREEGGRLLHLVFGGDHCRPGWAWPLWRAVPRVLSFVLSAALAASLLGPICCCVPSLSLSCCMVFQARIQLLTLALLAPATSAPWRCLTPILALCR